MAPTTVETEVVIPNDMFSPASNNGGRDTQPYNNSSGLSLFGFNDENDESLLLSPILADYVATSNNNNFHNPESHNNRSMSSTITSTLTIPQFSSPPPSIRRHSYSSTSSKQQPTTPLTSSSKRIRSSARLRRRRDILFASPLQQKFKIDEEDEEEQDSDDFIDGKEEAKSERRDIDTEVNEKNHLKIVSHDNNYSQDKSPSNDHNNCCNQSIQANENCGGINERKKLLLLGGELEASFCPSLGLGSSVSDGEDGGGRISITYNDSGIHSRNDYDYDYKLDGETQITKHTNRNTNIEEVNRLSITQNDFEKLGSRCSYSSSSSSSSYNRSRRGRNDERRSRNDPSDLKESLEEDRENEVKGSFSKQDFLEEKDITNAYGNTKLQEPEEKKEDERNKVKGEKGKQLSFEAQCENDNSTTSVKNLSQYSLAKKVQHQEQLEHHEQQLDRSSIQSLLNELEGVYTITNNSQNDNLEKRIEYGNDKSEKDSMNKTPPRSASRSKRESLSLTPKLKEAAKKALTPVLDVFRTKLARKKTVAFDDLGIDSSEMMMSSQDVKLSADGLEIGSEKKVSIHNEEHSTISSSSFKSPPLIAGNNKMEGNTGLTPVLKSLRSKLYVNGFLDDNDKDSSKIRMSNDDDISISNHKSFMKNSGLDESLVYTPENEKEKEKAIRKKSETLSESEELSLTPALEALRSKLLGKSSIDSSENIGAYTSVSPINNSGKSVSPDLMKEKPINRGSLRSPPLRERIPVKTPMTASSKNQSNMTDEDDSFLAQPKDLSSAKKNLNAQSTALVERLRGASQRRMKHLTKKRDSLAAKESEHLKRQVSEDSETKNKDAIETVSKNIVGRSERKPRNNQFKARPMPSFTKEDHIRSKDSKVVKKPTTKAISPKLGMRRLVNVKSDTQNIQRKANIRRNDSINVPSFKAKPMPSFCSKGLSRKGVPVLKKRQLTKPISPLLGQRTKKDNKKKIVETKSLHKKQHADRPIKKRNEPKTSPDLVGLEFLSETKKAQERENIPPPLPSYTFRLHSVRRAKDRAQFNESFALREREREKQKRKDVGELIKTRLRELDALKQSLR